MTGRNTIILEKWLLLLLFMAIEITHAAHNKTRKVLKAKKHCDEFNEKSHGHWEAKFKRRFAILDDEERKELAGLLPIDGNGTAVPFNKNQRNINISISANATFYWNYGPSNSSESSSSSSTENGGGGARRRKRATTCSTKMAFDARTQWPACAAIIGTVPDQAQCGSCWAVATASVFNDRYCIQRAKKGLSTDSASASSYFSAADLLACTPSTYGCSGGSPYYAWAFIKSKGVVTGTDYNTWDGCKPYPFPAYSRTLRTAPACISTCTNEALDAEYASDKKYATWTKYLTKTSATVTAIQNEIKANGSVVASMDVYEDFYYYSNGVYSAASSNYQGGHAIRLIGWGTQSCSDGTSQDFWLGVNSWNTDWGEAGLFKIAKGVDEVGIETGGIFYGMPKI